MTTLTLPQEVWEQAIKEKTGNSSIILGNWRSWIKGGFVDWEA
jgi:hypothetical protein